MLIKQEKQSHIEDDSPLIKNNRVLLLLLVGLILLLPFYAQAFSLSNFFKEFFVDSNNTSSPAAISHIEAEHFLMPVNNENPQAGIGGAEFQYIDDNSLLPVLGPLGNIAEADEMKSYKITTYTVREGDNLSLIAKTFGVSIGTIFWANDIKRVNLIRPGDTLVILPITGVQYKVKKGDSIGKIAKKYKTDSSEILAFNDLKSSDELIIGQEIIIPNVELSIPKSSTRRVYGGGPYIPGYFSRPINGGKKSQRLHGYNAVDLATYCGSPVYASAQGLVTVARKAGWNGGYGKYIVISHVNGVQTVYAHLGSSFVGSGWNVARGQAIGTVGSTGRSTGCHVHFEIRGAKNPF